MKFYNLIDTRLLVLTVNCYSDVQKDPQIIDIELIFRPYMSIPGQISGSIMKKRFGALKKQPFLRLTTLSGRPFWRL